MPPDETQGLKSGYFICQIPESPPDYRRTALVIIDMTYQQASREFGLFKRLGEAGLSEDAEDAIGRIEDVGVPSINRLASAFPEHGAPRFYTTCAPLPRDRSEQALRLSPRRRLRPDLAPPRLRARVLGRLEGRAGARGAGTSGRRHAPRQDRLERLQLDQLRAPVPQHGRDDARADGHLDEQLRRE